MTPRHSPSGASGDCDCPSRNKTEQYLAYGFKHLPPCPLAVCPHCDENGEVVVNSFYAGDQLCEEYGPCPYHDPPDERSTDDRC